MQQLDEEERLVCETSGTNANLSLPRHVVIVGVGYWFGVACECVGDPAY